MAEEKEDMLQDDLDPKDREFVMKTLTKYELLETDTITRLEKYRVFDNFVSGRQWIRMEDRHLKGRSELTVNFCDPIVRKYSALLMGEPPRISVPRESELEPIFDVTNLPNAEVAEAKNLEDELPQEFNRSEAIEKILRRVYQRDNNVHREWKEGAYNGATYGDTIFYVYWSKEDKKIKYENLFPGHVRIGFGTNNPTDIEYAFIEKVTSISEIERKYGVMVAPEQLDETTWNPQQFMDRPSAKVQMYWDKEVYAVLVGNQLLVKPVKHNYPRVPLFLIPNEATSKAPWGTSDLENVIDVQEEYNLAISEEADIVKIYSDPKVLVINPGKTNLKHFQASGAKVIPVSKDAAVRPFQFEGNIFPTQQRVQRIKQQMHDVSGLPEIAFGTAQGSIVTGVALTAQFSPTLQIIRSKIQTWTNTLTAIDAFVLELLEKFGGNEPTTDITYKKIINGWRVTDWQWGAKLPRDDSIFIANELNKLGARIQSRSRTMTNLGIPSPQDELQQIAVEERNPVLAPPKIALEQEALEMKAGGAGEEDEMIKLAQTEDDQMVAGNPVPTVGRNAKEHQIHIEIHGDFVKNLPPETDSQVIEIIDNHVAGHEQALATAGQHGGPRVGAGRPIEEVEGAPTPNAETLTEPTPELTA